MIKIYYGYFRMANAMAITINIDGCDLESFMWLGTIESFLESYPQYKEAVLIEEEDEDYEN